MRGEDRSMPGPLAWERWSTDGEGASVAGLWAEARAWVCVLKWGPETQLKKSLFKPPQLRVK